MRCELQRAGSWQRIAAGFLDGVLMLTLAVGLAALLSLVTGYDKESQKLDAIYARYESEYGIVFSIPEEEYTAMTDAQREHYDAAYEALVSDKEAMTTYNKVANLSLVVLSLSLLGALLLLEFVLPLLLKNGQTIGKKAFGLGLVRVDCVAVTPLQLFCRTLLGKYTLETMIPVYTGFMIFMGSAGMFGLLLIAGLLLAQVILFCASYNHNQIHDLIAGTVVVDVKSQMIFPTVEDRINYQKQAAAEEADRSPY